MLRIRMRLHCALSGKKGFPRSTSAVSLGKADFSRYDRKRVLPNWVLGLYRFGLLPILTVWAIVSTG